jgi:glycosyltransferase involved in cell wall biosynthesis
MTTDSVGGVWTFSTALARALCASGHEVVLVGMGPPPRQEQRAPIAGVPGLRFEQTDLALEWMDPEGSDVARAHNILADIAQRSEPDVVHLNGFREATFEFPAPVLVVAHSCVGSWWQACRPGVPIEPRWQGYLRDVARGLDRADVWVAPTRSHRRWIEIFYDPRKPGEAIWNGAPVANGAACPKQSFILAAGRLWDEAKNLRALERVASAVSWPVRIAGADRYPDGCAVDNVGGVEQLGELPHAVLMDWMRRAAIFVAPALYEPFGLTILEAANCGCALLLADISSLRELWDGAALFVHPRDDDGLARALETLARDEPLRVLLQREARKRARRYSLEAMVEHYRSLYERLTTSSRSRPVATPLLMGAAR